MSAVSAPSSETVTVPASPVACDGDVDAGLGHPRIYLDIPAGGAVTCPYCSRVFTLAPGAAAGRGH